MGIRDGLVRVSVGIEDAHDIVADFRQALALEQSSVLGAVQVVAEEALVALCDRDAHARSASTSAALNRSVARAGRPVGSTSQ